MGKADQREREPLTYATATPEQVAQARAEARRRLAEAADRRSPERSRALRELLGLDQPAA
jgi:hypothetical protein